MFRLLYKLKCFFNTVFIYNFAKNILIDVYYLNYGNAAIKIQVYF